MNRFACIALSLLMSFLGIGATGMGLCICSDGHVALEMGCDGGCREVERTRDCEPHTGDEALTATSGDGGGGCMYVPLLSAAALHSSSAKAQSWLSPKGLLLGAHQADDLNRGAHGSARANASRALCVSMYTPASVLAQRTIVLRI